MNSQETRRKVLVAEASDIYRCGLIHYLRQHTDVEIVAECVHARFALVKTMELQPHVAIVSASLGQEAFSLVRDIVDQAPSVNCLFISPNTSDAVPAVMSGTRGFCCSTEVTTSQMAIAVRSVADGAGWLDANVSGEVLCALRSPAGDNLTHPMYRDLLLTPRELQVLRLVVEGLTNPEIAEQLILSNETVRSHLKHIMDKLKVRDRTQAAVKAVRENLVPLGKTRSA
jgi:two-component system, NarL family, response regulator LiaR